MNIYTEAFPVLICPRFREATVFSLVSTVSKSEHKVALYIILKETYLSFKLVFLEVTHTVKL